MDPDERTLSPEEEQLLIIRDFLYEGKWKEIVADLKARQEGKPFVFKLNTRIEEDLQRIEKLETYERNHGVNLGEQLVRSEGMAQTPRDAYSEAPRGVKEAPETIELDSSSDSGTAG